MVLSSDHHDIVSPERRDEILTAIANRIVRHGLVTPAIFFLQMGKPLAFIGSQTVFMAQPFAGLFLNENLVEDFGHIMSDRENVERLLVMLEEKDAEARKKQKEAQAHYKAEKQKAKELQKQAKSGSNNPK